jgi:hypothetical protein
MFFVCANGKRVGFGVSGICRSRSVLPGLRPRRTRPGGGLDRRASADETAAPEESTMRRPTRPAA